ncbi:MULTISPECIES: hypothetical protein [unclassified Halomonas]|uniref:hypothetical protein n=1 Tax=unclassified Halomonas TaxID=2609666 RepID=UPI002886ED2C|nr:MULTISPECIES: hypothetical protein [unclassified Halomonas]MDT0501754.1 hypothetical protein [Halomonas sp. PAR7]MDT0513416.1 hypothetical protein [Halomonas sp. LES1]MDT0591817.1 hypothetical protein [Halomonas sp. PAR8]
MTIWVAAGLGGLIIILGANTVQAAPSGLISLIITLVIISGASLAMTRVKFEWKATQIERLIEHKEIQPDDEVPNIPVWQWPKRAEMWWTVSLLSVTLAGVLMILATWWKPVSQLCH